MRSRLVASCLLIIALSTARGAGPIPPGRQYRLTIEGKHTVTFVPQAGVEPVPIDYRAKVEYIVDTRLGKETKAQAEDDDPMVEKAESKKPASAKGRAKAKKPAAKASGAVDLSLHSSEMTLRQGGQPAMETRIDRSRFQGRLQPDSPVMSVTAADAPPQLQEILKTFDTVAATLAIDDDDKVIGRRFRFEGPRRAVTETILSIHAPIPRGLDSWEAPTQLAMGQGHTAKGKLRFEKVNPGEVTKPGDAIKVKVSGVLKAEGVLAGRFVKDGTYTVTGEQDYNARTKEWTSARWSVAVANELANQAGQTVAHSKGTMTVESRALGGASAADGAEPKL